MNRLETFNQFLATQTANIPVFAFLINLILAGFLAFLLSKIYVKYGNSISNRVQFARNFIMIAMTTMLIITIVKSSLALSLGLVGALSIVRFRAAIKEPEELAYLFLAISIGLGFGADQRVITLIGFLAITAFIILNKGLKNNTSPSNLHLTISYALPKKIDFEHVVAILREYCLKVQLKRFDETPQNLEAAFAVEFDNFKDLLLMKNKLKEKNHLIKITFLDTEGLM